ncbi:MAG: hypothetical protein IKB34_02680, partial [Clostridia bacterium]|nr:hypothetical protein [Clostridia bacterium]
LERSDRYIAPSIARYIAFAKQTYRPTEKRKHFGYETDLFPLSACYKGLGFLFHKAFDRSNAMLALSEIFKFSDKNITHSAQVVFFCLNVKLGTLYVASLSVFF